MLATYEYTAFGAILRQSGELAQKNPVRYSSRYLESNTGLYYYGYRHYSPSMMKWINKDFIAELGGVNLYMFCANNGIYFWDTLGLCAYMHMLDPFGDIEFYFKFYHDNNLDRFDVGVKFNTENVCPYVRVSGKNNNYTETIGVEIPIKGGTLNIDFTSDNSNLMRIGIVFKKIF